MTVQLDTQEDVLKLDAGTLSVEVEYKAKPSIPHRYSPSAEGTIGYDIIAPIYTDVQNQSWSTLLQRQAQLIQTGQYLCPEYCDGLKKLNFDQSQVSKLPIINKNLQETSGWQVVRVNGLVSPQNFFKLLSKKLFPCTDFIRHQDELEYTPAPDTFHDQVGHLPMITHKRFADFFQLFGKAGTRVRNETELQWFNCIYWFTVEFGLLNPTIGTAHYDPKQSTIYGAGIASSCGEIVYCLSDAVEKKPFDFDVVTNTPFNIHHMQTLLFEIPSFDVLESSFRSWALKHGFLEA